jgi:hypothetical protein
MKIILDFLKKKVAQLNFIGLLCNTKNKQAMNTMFSKSVEERAINLIIAGVDPIEAVKQALKQDTQLCEEMIAKTTDRSKKAKTQICKNVYGLIHITA